MKIFVEDNLIGYALMSDKRDGRQTMYSMRLHLVRRSNFHASSQIKRPICIMSIGRMDIYDQIEGIWAMPMHRSIYHEHLCALTANVKPSHFSHIFKPLISIFITAHFSL